MSATVADADGNPVRVAGKREPKLFKITYTLGANGDPANGTLLDRNDTALTLTRTGAGLFTLVVPAFPTGATTVVHFSSVQASPTVADMVPLTKTASTGTITMRFFANAIATPVDFSSGDELTLWALVDSSLLGGT